MPRRGKRAKTIRSMLGRKFELEHGCTRFRFTVVAYIEQTDKLEILENTDRRWIPAEMLVQAKHVKILREVHDVTRTTEVAARRT